MLNDKGVKSHDVYKSHGITNSELILLLISDDDPIPSVTFFLLSFFHYSNCCTSYLFRRHDICVCVRLFHTFILCSCLKFHIESSPSIASLFRYFSRRCSFRKIDPKSCKSISLIYAEKYQTCLIMSKF